ncbi:MAG: ATP-binding protein [Candidatus Sumerlaeia bacterium]
MSPAANTWLSNLPDPIPGILAKRRMGMVQLGIIGLLALAYPVFILQNPTLGLDAWFVILWGMLLLGIVGATLYTRSLNRQPPIISFMDFGVQVVFGLIKWLVLANIAWTAYAWFTNSLRANVLLDFLFRYENLPDLIAGPELNLFKLAFLMPLINPSLHAFQAAARARGFEKQLSPRQERKVQKLMRQGRRKLRQGKTDEADILLKEASSILSDLMAGTSNKGVLYHRRLMRERIAELLGHAPSRDFQTDPFGENAPTMSTAPLDQAGPGRMERPQSPQQAQGADSDLGYEKYRDFLESLREKSSVQWDEVAGLNEVVTELKNAFGMALAKAPDGITFDPPRRILLYGPPGTGKTLLTAAVSNNFDAAFFNIKVSDVLSKFFGESTRLISALFQLAAEESPSVLFFDEIESITGSRDARGMDGEERRMVSAILAELDGLKSKDDKRVVFTIAATNMPWQIDPAILSRFEKQFYIPLPDDAARTRIFEVLLDKRGFSSQPSHGQLVQYTRGYSGRELRALCQEAIRLMMNENNPDMNKVVDRGKAALEKYKMKVAPIQTKHWNEAFRRFRPQTNAQMLRRYEEWQSR